MGKTFLNLFPTISQPSSVIRNSTRGGNGVEDFFALATIRSTGFLVCLMPHRPRASADPSSLTENDFGSRWCRTSSSIYSYDTAKLNSDFKNIKEPDDVLRNTSTVDVYKE